MFEVIRNRILLNTLNSFLGGIEHSFSKISSSLSSLSKKKLTTAILDSKGKVVTLRSQHHIHPGVLFSSATKEFAQLDWHNRAVKIASKPGIPPFIENQFSVIAPLYLTQKDQPDLFIAFLTPLSALQPITIPYSNLIKDGHFDRTLLNILIANSKSPFETESDILAMSNTIKMASENLAQFARRYNASHLAEDIEKLFTFSQLFSRSTIDKIPDGEYCYSEAIKGREAQNKAQDYDLNVSVSGRSMQIAFTFDSFPTSFTPEDLEIALHNAVLHLLMIFGEKNLPMNSDIFLPVSIKVPESDNSGSVHEDYFDIQQSISSLLFGALHSVLPEDVVVAAGGRSISLVMQNNKSIFQSELAAGGGASMSNNGQPGTLCTNITRINSIEEIEKSFPVIIEKELIRKKSGGSGRASGGDGMVRKYQILSDAYIQLREEGIISSSGIAGGSNGATGKATLHTRNGPKRLATITEGKIKAGSILQIESSGGGGYGCCNN